MNYIIFDLEWNNAFNYKTQKGMNEIIEIGAVKLNNNLEFVDTFKQLIKPQVSKKLGSRFKNLTNITMEEINQSGVDFQTAFADFARWAKGEDTLFLTWSTSDLYTLVDNFLKFNGSANIDFITSYADVQKYCMHFIETQNGNQISLSDCAEIFDIDINNLSLHRALEDCYVEALCFKKVYNKELLKQYIHKCDVSFFERLIFKPYSIKPNNKNFDINDVHLSCPKCNGEVQVIREYDYNNNTFKSAGKCIECKNKFWIFVRAKQTYDEIVVNKRLIEINKKRARYIN